MLVGLTVLLGSVIGAAIVMPTEERSSVIVFAIVNAVFAAMVTEAALAGISLYRDMRANRR